MNRYPVWKYTLIAIALVLGFLYTLPNFFGESPAVQVSSGKVTLKLDAGVLARVEQALKAAKITYTAALLDANSVRVRFADTDTQLKAKDLINQMLNPDATNPSYVVALNLLSSSPNWLTAIHALPMYLGLDLRGGVHFLLQVDMQAALTKRLDSLAGDVRSLLRDKNIRHSGIAREGQTIRIRFRDAETRDKAKRLLGDNMSDLLLAETQNGAEFRLTGDAQAGSDQAHSGIRAQAEHHHPAQPHQRTRRGRAGHPAAGCRPHRRAAARRAGHRQGQGHPRAHRHAWKSAWWTRSA